MSLKLALSLCLVAGASGFSPAPFGVSPRLSLSLSSEPEPPSSAIVPVEVNKGNTQFAAGVLGGTVGLFLAGPIGASLGAGFLNYASKQEDEEISTAVNSVSSVAINLFNYATRLNEKYELLNQAQVQLEKSYEKIKGNASVDPATVQQVEDALSQTKSKIEEVNDEYNLVGAGLKVLGVLGEVTEKAVLKAIELNTEYNLTDKAQLALGEAINKAKTGVASEQAGKRASK